MWSLHLRKKLLDQLLPGMSKNDIFKKKGIDPNSYKISFSFSTSTPIQGDLYGDCGVWVCIMLYRLAYGVSMDTRCPIKTALAYREHMTRFFWKYKIPR